VRELGRLVQEDDEFGLLEIDWIALSSVESLSQYDFDELPGQSPNFPPPKATQKRSAQFDAKETIHELLKGGYSAGGPDAGL